MENKQFENITLDNGEFSFQFYTIFKPFIDYLTVIEYAFCL